jgi:hypothetical protein
MHYEFFPQVQTVNQHYYTNILKNMLHMWNSGSSNVQFSTIIMHLLIYFVCAGISGQKQNVTPHPPYSSDFVPLDFFPKIWDGIKWREM